MAFKAEDEKGMASEVPDMNSEFLKDAEARIGAKPIWAGGSAVNPVTMAESCLLRRVCGLA